MLGHIDEAILELDDIDMQITGYRMQLNAVSDDISYIESQNRGLQVQTSNQQALLDELRQLLVSGLLGAADASKSSKSRRMICGYSRRNPLAPLAGFTRSSSRRRHYTKRYRPVWIRVSSKSTSIADFSQR